MSDAILFANISTLPDNLKAEVADFVSFLQQKVKFEMKGPERKLGGLKGTFIVSPDFDDPLYDFKDYM